MNVVFSKYNEKYAIIQVFIKNNCLSVMVAFVSLAFKVLFAN